MPRAALIHDFLPGVLSPDNENIRLCDKDKARHIDHNCEQITEALAGSGKAALNLAESRKHEGQTESTLYWYTIAAQNGDAYGMVKIGTALYFTPFKGDPVGSRIRGRFWLERAAKNGSRSARRQLKKIYALEKNQNVTETNSATLPNQLPGSNQPVIMPMLTCGKHPKGWPNGAVSTREEARLPCEDIPILERQALAGSGRAAFSLNWFLSHHGNYPAYKENLYWNTIAAENGDSMSMGLTGAILWHENKAGGSRARGAFWLEQSARSGDKNAKGDLEYFEQEKSTLQQ